MPKFKGRTNNNYVCNNNNLNKTNSFLATAVLIQPFHCYQWALVFVQKQPSYKQPF